MHEEKQHNDLFKSAIKSKNNPTLSSHETELHHFVGRTTELSSNQHLKNFPNFSDSKLMLPFEPSESKKVKTDLNQIVNNSQKNMIYSHLFSFLQQQQLNAHLGHQSEDFSKNLNNSFSKTQLNDLVS